MAENGGLWLYAVARELDEGVLTGLTGVADAPVRAVAGAGLTTVVSPVGLDEFGEEALKRNLEDLDWLNGTARAHDAVVTSVTGATTAAPMRLATVYLDDERVRAMLVDRGRDLRAALDLLDGRTEWGLKAYADPERLAQPAARPAATSGGAGAAYLRRRREQLSAREKAEQAATAQAERVHEELAGIAVAARRHPPQDRKLSGQPGWMVLNGAYLVDDTRAGDLAATVRRLESDLPGMRLELTGPWSPYSFAGAAWGPR